MANGYNGKTLKFKNTRWFHSGPFRKIICGEYYLQNYKGIFASHFGRGSSLRAPKYLRGWKKKMYFIPIIGKHLLKTRGKREKKKG